MMIGFAAAVACVILSASIAEAQQPASPRIAPPTPDSLAAITTRGRILAAYDASAWHATDALTALRPDAAAVRGYVARLGPDGWQVAFGRLSDDSTAFLIAYRASAVTTHADSFVVERLEPVVRDTGYFARAARALATAGRDFGTPSRPYNPAVVPAGDGDSTWWVYLMPAQTVAGVYPVGEDVRYRISHDGLRILDRRQLHKALMEFRAPPPGTEPQAAMHAAVLDDIPEDSDVFHVIVRRPQVPQLIVTNAFIYQIEVDGRIRLMGRREDILGPGN